jgi:hypothetical protein
MVRDFISDTHKFITALIPLIGFASTDTMVTFKVLFWVFLQSLIHMLDNCAKIPPAYGNEDVWWLWLHIEVSGSTLKFLVQCVLFTYHQEFVKHQSSASTYLC